MWEREIVGESKNEVDSTEGKDRGGKVSSRGGRPWVGGGGQNRTSGPRLSLLFFCVGEEEKRRVGRRGRRPEERRAEEE